MKDNLRPWAFIVFKSKGKEMNSHLVYFLQCRMLRLLQVIYKVSLPFWVLLPLKKASESSSCTVVPSLPASLLLGVKAWWWLFLPVQLSFLSLFRVLIFRDSCSKTGSISPTLGRGGFCMFLISPHQTEVIWFLGACVKCDLLSQLASVPRRIPGGCQLMSLSCAL